jgi:tetratricopeptide (TPR) repeat protein
MATVCMRQPWWVVVVSVVALAGCSRDPEARARAYIESGDKLASEGRYADAAIEYRNAIKATPEAAAAYQRLADAAAHADDAPTAVGALLRVAELKPDDPAAQVRAASLYLLAGQFEEARNRATAALNLNQTDAAAHLLLGQALAGLHDVESGEAALVEAVRLAPRSPEPHVALGSHYWSNGRIDAARTEIEAALALDPGHLDANRALAIFYMATGRQADAEPLWRRIAEAPQGSPFALADYYIAVNRLPEAEALLRGLAAQPAHSTEGNLRLAAVQYARGEREAAYRVLDSLLARKPKTLGALMLQARLLAQDGRYDDALARARAAVAADVTSAEAVAVEGEIYAAKGDHERAVRSFQAALRLDPADARPYVAIAQIRLRQRHATDALEAARRAVDAAPDLPAARSVLVEALAAAGQRDRAEVEAAESVKRWPRNAILHAELGAVRWLNGHADQARAAFDEALDLDPGVSAAITGLTRLDLQANRPQAALGRLSEAVRRRPDDPVLRLLQAEVYLAARNNGEAEKILTRLVESRVAAADAGAMLGQMYLREGNLDAARVQFERVASASKASAASTVVGMIFEAQGRPADAQRVYERTLVVDARAGIAANNLAWIYLGQGRLDEALKLALIADQELGSPEAKDTLGWIYVQRNQPRDAVAPLATSVDARPDKPLYRYHLGVAYWKAGSTAQARLELRRALASKVAFDGRADAVQIANALEREELERQEEQAQESTGG